MLQIYIIYIMYIPTEEKNHVHLSQIYINYIVLPINMKRQISHIRMLSIQL